MGAEQARAAPVLVVGNYKGGVGKTFVSKHLAEYAAIRRNLRVLLIDLDPQTNLSRRYLDMEQATTGEHDYTPPLHPEYVPGEDPDWNGYSDSSEIWRFGGAVPYPTAYPGLEIIPAHSQALQEIEYVTKADIYEKVVKHLRQFVLCDDIQGAYDLVILDTRPSKGALVQSAMNAASHLLIPSELEAPSVEGLRGMLSVRSQVNFFRAQGQELKLVGILPNKIRTNALIHDQFFETLREDPVVGPALLPAHINDWVVYKEMMIHGMPSPFAVAPSNRRAIEQLEMVGELVLNRIFEEENRT